MRPERYQQVEQLLQDVLALPAARRAPFLRRSCGDDRELRAEVEELLRSHEAAAEGSTYRLFPVGEAVADAEPAESATPLLPPGSLVADRYRTGELVGRGGMGAVYEVHDQLLDDTVALKILHAGSTFDPKALRSFKQEVLLARQVSHPNVCRLFDFGVHHTDAGEVPFLTMELLRGETLAARLRASGRMPVEAALPLVRQIAAGLQAAHRAGVVHRDLKTENVVLVPGAAGDRAVVTDFGIARPTELGDGTGGTATIVGTPAYIAPEVLTGKPAGPAADIYALGIILYNMVTGELPFPGVTPFEVAALRLHRDPPLGSTQLPDLEPRWDQVIHGYERAARRVDHDRSAVHDRDRLRVDDVARLVG